MFGSSKSSKSQGVGSSIGGWTIRYSKKPPTMFTQPQSISGDMPRERLRFPAPGLSRIYPQYVEFKGPGWLLTVYDQEVDSSEPEPADAITIGDGGKRQSPKPMKTYSVTRTTTTAPAPGATGAAKSRRPVFGDDDFDPTEGMRDSVARSNPTPEETRAAQLKAQAQAQQNHRELQHLQHLGYPANQLPSIPDPRFPGEQKEFDSQYYKMVEMKGAQHLPPTPAEPHQSGSGSSLEPPPRYPRHPTLQQEGLGAHSPSNFQHQEIGEEEGEEEGEEKEEEEEEDPNEMYVGHGAEPEGGDDDEDWEGHGEGDEGDDVDEEGRPIHYGFAH